jgi:uncharacterized protein YlxP (DUF503 family)
VVGRSPTPSGAGFVGVLLIHLHFPDAASLKGKRRELQSVKAQLRTRMGLSVAEVDHQDKWQRATLAVALVSGSAGRLQADADRVCRWLDARFPQGVHVDRLLTSVSDLEG